MGMFRTSNPGGSISGSPKKLLLGKESSVWTFVTKGGQFQQKRLLLISWGGSDGKESACKAGDPGSIPQSGRSPEGGHGNPLFLPGGSQG